MSKHHSALFNRDPTEPVVVCISSLIVVGRGEIEMGDQTDMLRTKSYWPSFNIP